MLRGEKEKKDVTNVHTHTHGQTEKGVNPNSRYLTGFSKKTILARHWEHYETVGVSDMSVSNCPAAKKLKCPPVNLSAPASPRHWCQRAPPCPPLVLTGA